MITDASIQSNVQQMEIQIYIHISLCQYAHTSRLENYHPLNVEVESMTGCFVCPCEKGQVSVDLVGGGTLANINIVLLLCAVGAKV